MFQIMLQFSFTGLNLIIFILTVVAQDIAPNVYCNKQNLTWDQARESCMNAKGKFIAYKTGLGMDVAKLSLKSETDIWTADYAWEPTNSKWTEKLCGFCYMDRGKFCLQVMYGDCDKAKHFVCRNSSTNELDVFFGRRDSINCSATRINSSKSQDLPPGFYWTNSTVNVTTDKWSSDRLPWHRPFWCGAYKKSIGKYFGECVTKRVSLCSIDATTNTYRHSFDKSCFDNRSHSSSPKTASQNTQSTHVVLNTMAQTTVMQTKTCLKSVATQIETTATTTTTTTTVMRHVTKSIHPRTVTSWEDGRLDKQNENETNIGVKVGLPVGLGIVVICGIILSIYIIRRYKRKSDNTSPRSKVFWNSAYSTHGKSSRFNKNTKSSSDPIVDKGNDKSEMIQGDPLKNKDSEYAVVHKYNPCHRKERSLSKEKHGDLNNPGFAETRSSYYANVEENEYARPFTEPKTVQMSEYRFAKEITGDKEENKGTTATDIEDEYDVTNNTPTYRSPNNIYNTLQSGDYGRFSHVRTDETAYNVLRTPQSLASDTVYDSAKQNDHSGTIDDTYNHITEPETYGSSSISIGRKLQNRKDTDQTYDKLS